jgi:DNA helicase-2/ATP-dependent DNA helicase PcrA
VVGDPDQSIYGWRGADMSMILNFEKDFPGGKVYILDQNYRSTGNILAGANALILGNSKRRKKELWTIRDKGERIHVLLAPDETAEATSLVSSIHRLHDKERYDFGISPSCTASTL